MLEKEDLQQVGEIITQTVGTEVSKSVKILTEDLKAFSKAQLSEVEVFAKEQIRTASAFAEEMVGKARIDAEKLLTEHTLAPPRFVDVSRVPLICQSIISINESLKELKAHVVTRAEFEPVKEGAVMQIEFKPIKLIVYGMVSLILIAVLGALVGLVVLK